MYLIWIEDSLLFLIPQKKRVLSTFAIKLYGLIRIQIAAINLYRQIRVYNVLSMFSWE